jgi:hypothetical protein
MGRDRQCGPPGWRSELHQARDLIDRTGGGRDPSRPAQLSKGRREGAVVTYPEGSLDGQVPCDKVRTSLCGLICKLEGASDTMRCPRTT